MKRFQNVPLLLFALNAFLLAAPLSVSAAPDLSVPSIIKDGFKIWPAKDASYAIDIWKKGGLLENDNKPNILARYFGQMDHTLGHYLSYEAIDSKPVGQSSKILYVAINFDQAAVYGRFLLYRTGSGWVVQNMDFSAKPEAIMPWLSFAGENYGQ
jgi:hypothetical protein